jgi:hypothetical protein
MKKSWFVLTVVLTLAAITACKSRKKEVAESEKITSAISFIKSQVAGVDTSLYAIQKIVYVDSARSDTTFYSRGQFRQLAAEFLSLPDVSGDPYAGRFKEESRYDETLQRVIITCLPVNPEKEEIQRQEILIEPDPSGDKITNIIIDYQMSNKDSAVEKRMLWQVDRSFQVATTKQLMGQPETISRYKVAWNEDENE